MSGSSLRVVRGGQRFNVFCTPRVHAERYPPPNQTGFACGTVLWGSKPHPLPRAGTSQADPRISASCRVYPHLYTNSAVLRAPKQKWSYMRQGSATLMKTAHMARSGT